MPHTEVDPRYVINCSSHEFRIIGLALSGKLKDKDDVASALKLNADICHQRAKHLKDQLSVAEACSKQANDLRPPLID